MTIQNNTPNPKEATLGRHIGLGGGGLIMATIARVYEELAKVDIGFTSALAVHNNVTIAASLIENRSLRNPCLEKLMSGARVTYY